MSIAPPRRGRDRWVPRASWPASLNLVQRDPSPGGGIDRGSYSVLLWPSHESLPCKGGFNTGTKGENGTGKRYNTLL